MKKLVDYLPKTVLKEAKELSENPDFSYFYVDSVKDSDVILDIGDMLDKDYLEVTLCTDKNKSKDKKDTFKVSSQEVYDFLQKNYQLHNDDSYTDFIGEYQLLDLVGNFIESQYGVKYYKNYPEFLNVHDVQALTENSDPTKKEMVRFLKKEFDWAGIEDMDFDIEEAIYWFAYEYHGGQRSNLYSALSTSPYKPSRLMRNSDDIEKGTTSKYMYDSLVDKFS